MATSRPAANRQKPVISKDQVDQRTRLLWQRRTVVVMMMLVLILGSRRRAVMGLLRTHRLYDIMV